MSTSRDCSREMAAVWLIPEGQKRPTGQAK